jgi:hypothetical protein
MKYIKAVLILIRLIASRGHREQWRQSTNRLSDANDEIEAGLHRLDAMENGGKPKMRLLSTSINSDKSRQN